MNKTTNQNSNTMSVNDIENIIAENKELKHYIASLELDMQRRDTMERDMLELQKKIADLKTTIEHYKGQIEAYKYCIAHNH